MRPRTIQQLLLIGAAAALASCPGPDAPRTPPNVVVIVLDTVRPDHLSCYGYSRRTTPNLDAFADEADRYTNARSTAPWTLPSHASLFTGLFPFQHRADAFLKGDEVMDAAALAPEATTLAEVLQSEGFATGGFTANRGYLNRASGLDQGFAEYVNDRKDSAGMSAMALAWLAKPTTTRPFFVFLNYMDAHRTYNTTPLPPERAAELPAPPAQGETADKYLDALCEHVLGQDTPPDPALVQRTKDAYDLALANLDIGLGQLFDGLKAAGAYDDALIVVCADHGEYFGEHDLVEHSKDVYEAAMRIPLIIKRPGQREGRVIDEPISIADVPQLVLRSFPPDVTKRHATKFPGTRGVGSMLGQINYTRPKDLNRPWGMRFRRERNVLYEGRFKLIRSSDGAHELYDLDTDAGETTNLFGTHAKEAAALMARLEELESRASTISEAQSPRVLTDEELKELEGLGYVDPNALKNPK